MYYAKQLADNLEAYFDDNTGLTHYPDGSIVDVFGAHIYPDDDLYEAYTYDELLSDETLADKL